MPFVKMAFLLIFHIHFCAHCTNLVVFDRFRIYLHVLYTAFLLRQLLFFYIFFRIINFSKPKSKFDLHRNIFAPFYHIQQEFCTPDTTGFKTEMYSWNSTGYCL